MNYLRDIITYVRRIVKTPSNASLSDNLIIDYINRFWMMDVDARLQMFDLKTQYQFQTTPGVDQYNMPLYNVQNEGGQTVGMYPVYQGFTGSAWINGVQVPIYTQKNLFYNLWPDVAQNLGAVAQGDSTLGGGTGPYTLTFPILPFNSSPINPPVQGLLRGHVDIQGIIATQNNIDPPIGTTINTLIPSTSILPRVYITSTLADGSNVVVQDSGQFLAGNTNYGLLMTPGPAPFGYAALPGGYSITSNTINYFSGVATVTFPVAIPNGVNINVACLLFQTGLPRAVLYYNNTLTLRSPPDSAYLVVLDAYLSPSAFFNTDAAIPYGYMAEYIARGAARKLLSDTGDVEQMQFYEPLFREQEALVWKRSQRQWTATRTETIYSQGFGQGMGMNNFGGGNP